MPGHRTEGWRARVNPHQLLVIAAAGWGERHATDVTAPSLRNTVYHSFKYLLSIYDILDTILGAGTQN